MHDETIPAPLLPRDDAVAPPDPAGYGLMWKVVAIGILVLWVIVPLVR